MIPTLDWVLLVLATARLQSLWFEEVARPLRERLAHRKGRLGYLAQCPLCVSVWASAVILGSWVVPGGRWVVLGLAISTGVLAFNQVLGRLTAPAGPPALAQALARQAQAQQQARERERVNGS